jgi:hypothetical protein
LTFAVGTITPGSFSIQRQQSAILTPVLKRPMSRSPTSAAFDARTHVMW